MRYQKNSIEVREEGKFIDEKDNVRKKVAKSNSLEITSNIETSKKTIK